MAETTLTAWVVRKAGGLPAARYPIRKDVLRIGRSADNDIILDDELLVSARHLEIHCLDGVYKLCDLESTNGTYLNGERITECVIQPPASIRLGALGPELDFVLDDACVDLNATMVGTASSWMIEPSEDVASISQEHEKLLSKAVARARRARHNRVFDQTAMIMRSMLGEALQKTTQKFKIAIVALVIALAGVSVYGFWQIMNLRKEKRALDAQMQRIELEIANTNQNPVEVQQLLSRLDQVQGQEKALESTLLYRYGAREPEDPVKRGIHSLMAEFDAETYSIPPEFLDAVKAQVERYQGPDRLTTERALGAAKPSLEIMQEIFKKHNLPPDLAYMALAESGLKAGENSPAGAAGWWQFTPATARIFGLRVDGPVDERRDARKSTEAAARYIRNLILDFGAGSSVMLAMAAYDLGPTKVKQAIRHVTDPIRQRDFWYLYRTRALPKETREYVPKVIAAMVIARDPEQFGFQ